MLCLTHEVCSRNEKCLKNQCTVLKLIEEWQTLHNILQKPHWRCSGIIIGLANALMICSLPNNYANAFTRNPNKKQVLCHLDITGLYFRHSVTNWYFSKFNQCCVNGSSGPSRWPGTTTHVKKINYKKELYCTETRNLTAKVTESCEQSQQSRPQSPAVMMNLTTQTYHDHFELSCRCQ